MAADAGTGATFSLVGAPAGFFDDAVSISWSGAERPSIDVTTLGSTVAREFIPGDLIDWGEIVVTVLVPQNSEPPLGVVAGNAVLTYPDGTTYTWANSFATGWSADNPLEERVEGELTVKLNGDVTIV